MPDIHKIQKIVGPIAHFYGVKRVYLFGSYAKGTANEKSDIDLLVEKWRKGSPCLCLNFPECVKWFRKH